MYMCAAQWKHCRGPTVKLFNPTTIPNTHCCERHKFQWDDIRTLVQQRWYKHYANAPQYYVERILPISFPCLLLTNFAKGSPFVLHMILKLVCTTEVSLFPPKTLPPFLAYPKSPRLFLEILRHTRSAESTPHVNFVSLHLVGPVAQSV